MVVLTRSAQKSMSRPETTSSPSTFTKHKTKTKVFPPLSPHPDPKLKVETNENKYFTKNHLKQEIPTPSSVSSKTPSEQIDFAIMNMNPLLQVESMGVEGEIDADEYMDFDHESTIDDELIPSISIRFTERSCKRNHEENSLIQIRVRPGCLSRESLSRSILQVYEATTGKPFSKYQNFREEYSIEGLFRESDRLFIPLYDILHAPGEYNTTIFSLYPPPLPSPVSSASKTVTSTLSTKISEFPKMNMRNIFSYGSFAIGVFFILGLNPMLLCGECIWDYVCMFWRAFFFIPLWIDKVFVELPLRQIYRYGPSFFGWEGAKLSSICTQITSFGNDTFWEHNMEDCKQILVKRVAEYIWMLKPFIYAIAFTAISVVMRLVNKSKYDGKQIDIEDIYKVMHILTKQFKKAMND